MAPHLPRTPRATRFFALCAGFAFASSVDAFTVDALWDAGGLQICTNANPITFHVHARPIRMSYACLTPSAPLRTCYFDTEPGLQPHNRLLTIKCTITPSPPDDPDRIHLAGFEHREQDGF
jgi:hypothetical protein